MKNWLFLSALLLLSGCVEMPKVDEVLDDRKVEYKKSKDAEVNLEVPPDLTSDAIDNSLVVPDVAPKGSATYSQYSNERKPGVARPTVAGGKAVLPNSEDISLQRDGNKRWLVIKSSPDEVWPVVLGFWQENGILLLEQNPEAGVMTTAWIENRADIKSDFITDALKSTLGSIYSTGSRDQFRVRLERGQQANTTELYLTHKGMEEKIVRGSTNEAEQSVWSPRDTDPGLEAVMLQRLMVHLGVTDNRAKTLVADKAGAAQATARSQLQRSSGNVALTINEDMERSWRLTGMALDRVGFAVEDRNRQDGVYYVRYNDPYAGQEKDEGLLSKLAFWSEQQKINKDTQYQVKLSPAGDRTNVTIHNDKGVPDHSETAARILTLLHEQIH